MASFRILNQAPQYLLPNGNVNAGGRLYFFDTGLSTPKDTWSDEAMTVLNSNPVVMDAVGRTLTDVWGDGEYGVVMTDALEVPIWTRNNVKAGGDDGGGPLPTLGAGQFWSSDGSQVIVVDVLAVPDPTGQTGDILYSDGSLPYWAAPPAIPEIPAPDIIVTDTSFQAGVSDDESKFFVQRGTGSAPASGSYTTSDAIDFPVPFAALWNVCVTVTTDRVTTGDTGWLPAHSVTGWTPGSPASSATVNFTLSEDDPGPACTFTSAVPFAWIAFGERTVTP